MTRKQVTPWLIVPSQASTWTGVELVEADPRIVPTLLAAMEPRKTRSSWLSDADFEVGYDALCKQGVALLMGAREDIIREIRGVRGTEPFTTDTSLESYPVGDYPGAQLADLLRQQEVDGESTAQILVSIRQLIQEQGTDSEELLELLGQIALLLGV